MRKIQSLVVGVASIGLMGAMSACGDDGGAILVAGTVPSKQSKMGVEKCGSGWTPATRGSSASARAIAGGAPVIARRRREFPAPEG